MINLNELTKANELRREDLLTEAAQERLASALAKQAPLASARIKERLERVMAKAEERRHSLPQAAKHGLQVSE